jgi:hypothetical protein
MVKGFRLMAAVISFAVAAAAGGEIAGGTTGELKWSISEDGTLTISGQGAMPNYVMGEGDPVPRQIGIRNHVRLMTDFTRLDTPWDSYHDTINKVVVENGVTRIGWYAFSSCRKLTSAVISNSVTYIGNKSFQNCIYLKSIVIPDSVKGIGNSAFAYCSGLTSAVIPNSVASIGYTAFYGCYGLKQITNLATTPQAVMVSEGWFNGVNTSSVKLYVPAQSLDAYKTADIWKDFDIEAINDGDTPIKTATPKKSVSVISFAGIKNGEINLNFKTGNYTVELYNLQGRLVSSVNIDALNGLNATGIKTNNLSKGMFILNVKQAGAVVLKQKVKI